MRPVLIFSFWPDPLPTHFWPAPVVQHMARPVTSLGQKADMNMIIKSISSFGTERATIDGLDNHARVSRGWFLSVWGVSRTVTGVSRVTYQGNKGNKSWLTGGQKMIKSRTLGMLTGGHSWMFGMYLVLFSSLSFKKLFSSKFILHLSSVVIQYWYVVKY